MYFVVDGAALVYTGLPVADPGPVAEPEPGGGGGGGGGDVVAGRARAARKGERIVGKGDVFGEGGLFTQELGRFRRESAEAMSWLSVYVLSASALREISAEHPEVCPALRRQCSRARDGFRRDKEDSRPPGRARDRLAVWGAVDFSEMST